MRRSRTVEKSDGKAEAREGEVGPAAESAAAGMTQGDGEAHRSRSNEEHRRTSEHPDSLDQLSSRVISVSAS